MNTNADLSGILLWGQQSDVGKRPNQEDRWDVREFQTADGRTATLALVADGIAGHSSGEMASEMAKNTIPTRLLADPPAASEITSRLKAVLEETGQAIYNASLEVHERSGMGATCTAVVIADRRLYLAHVGNSRAYLLRGGRLHQLTIDHTWAEEAIRAGRSPMEIRIHPNRGVIMRYLGIDGPVNVDTRYRALSGELVQTLDAGPLFLEPGDTLMLSSGGVSDALEPRQVAEFLSYPDCQVAADALVSSALAAGASSNVTAVVLRLPGAVVVPPEAFAGADKKRSVLPFVLGGVALLVVVGAVLASALSRGETPVPAASPTAQAAAVGATEVLARAAGPTADLSGGEVQVATVAPATEEATEAVAAATFPAVSASEPVSPTSAISGTVIMTGTLPGEPRIAPTFTPIPTPTPMPTRAAEPTATPPPARPSPTQALSTSRGVALLQPAEGAKIVGEAEFIWQDEPGFYLGPGEQYELIVWGLGEDPMRDGRSPVGAALMTSARTNLEGVESVLGLSGGKTYFWGIRLLAYGVPSRMVSGGRPFVYERASTGGSDSGGGCTGPDCSKD